MPAVVAQLSRFGEVIRIRLGRRILGQVWQWANAFWVDGLLIETSFGHGVPTLMRLLDQEGLRVEQVVNTHSHEDHVAANAALHRRFGVTPRVHALGLERLRHPLTRREQPLYRRVVWGMVEPSPGEPLGGLVETDRYRLQVLHTPGHAPDHVALWEERQGWLFSGDLLISPRLPVVRAGEEPLQILASLRQVVGLPVQRLFCSHYYKVPESAEPLAAKIRHWEGLRQQARELQQQGWPVSRVARGLLGRGGLVEFISGGEYHRRHLIAGLLQEASVDGKV